MGRYLHRYPTTTKVDSHEALGENLAASPATSSKETSMASNAEQTVHQIQHDFQNLTSCKFFGDDLHLRGGLLGEPQLFPLLVEFNDL